jgi:ribosomal protein S18 acetylase RimI-like enzyme
MNVTIRVRPATEAEYEVAGEICVSAYRADGQLPSGKLPDGHDYSVALADVAGRAEHADILVAVDDRDEVLGCVTFIRPDSPYAEVAEPDEAEFRMLAVAPQAQGRGVASALVRTCLDHATALGYRAIVICVRDFNDTAKRLYARFGFVRLPERDFAPIPEVRLEALRIELPG